MKLNKKLAATVTKNIILLTQDALKQKDDPQSAASIIYSVSGNMYFSSLGSALIAKTSNSILSIDRVDRAISEECVTNWITNTVRQIIQDNSLGHLRNYIDNMIDDLFSDVVKRRFFVPLTGIIASYKPFRLGNVLIKRISKNDMSHFDKCLEDSAIMNPDVTVDGVHASVSHREWIYSAIFGQTCAVCTIAAEYDKARRLAVRESRHAVALLHLILRMITHNRHTIKIGIVADFPENTLTIPSITFSPAGYQINEKAPEHFEEMHTSNIRLKFLEQSKLSVASSLFQKKNLSEFKLLIRQAIIAYSKAQNANTDDSIFLRLYSTVEMIKPPSGISVKRFLSIILGSDETTRNKIYDAAEIMQKKRGALSHQNIDKIHEIDILVIDRFALATIIFGLIKIDDFANMDEVIKWIEQNDNNKSFEQSYLLDAPMSHVLSSIQDLID